MLLPPLLPLFILAHKYEQCVSDTHKSFHIHIHLFFWGIKNHENEGKYGMNVSCAFPYAIHDVEREKFSGIRSTYGICCVSEAEIFG